MQSVQAHVVEFIRARSREIADEITFTNAEYQEVENRSAEEWQKIRDLLGEKAGPLFTHESLVNTRQLIAMRLAYRQGIVDALDVLGLDWEKMLGGIASYIGMNRQATGTLETLSSQSGTSAA